MQRSVGRSICITARRVALLGLLRVQLISSDGCGVERLQRLLGHQEIHIGDEAEILTAASNERVVGDSRGENRGAEESDRGREERGGQGASERGTRARTRASGSGP